MISKNKLRNQAEPVDTVARSANNYNITLLADAQRCWDSLLNFRKERARNKRYTYGDQWSDIITDENGKQQTESQYMTEKGNMPLKNNLIRRLVKTVTGQYRSNQTEPICVARDRNEQKLGEMMSVAMQYNYQINKMSEIDGRSMEEFLISGAAIHKETFGWRKDKMEVWTDIVNPNRLFFDTRMEDVRHWDCNLIGEIHDIPLMDLLGRFSTSREEALRLKQLYRTLSDPGLVRPTIEALTGRKFDNITFLTPDDPTLCRIVEIWRKEQKERIRCHDILNGEYYKEEVTALAAIKQENSRRTQEGATFGIPPQEIPQIEYEWFIDEYWYYRFLTPTGEVLKEGETPFTHREHPYTIKLYPFLDGEVHSFVSDIIDQQRYVNRLITLIDFIMRASSKGVLMFPEELIPGDMDKEKILDEWVRYNGVIFYRSKPGVQMPQQIATNSTNVGAYELLSLQMKLMEEISGVHGAMQGKEAPSGTASSLYRQQVENASTTLVDLFDSFKNFREERDLKKMKMIQQFYSEKRYMNIVGAPGRSVHDYDPRQVSNVEFDLAIAQNTSAPAFRAVNNEFLMQLFQMGQISVEMLLENGAFPFADQLLQSIQTQKQQMQQGQATQIDPALMQQVSQAADPQVVNQINQTR